MRKPGIRFKLVASLFTVIVLPLLLTPFTAFGISTVNGSPANSADWGMALVGMSVFIPLIFCTMLITRMITVKILRPLKELTLAAENIVQGNLDFHITYKSNDEMGKLSEVFELMRSRLLESMMRQHAYEQARKELISSISHDIRTPLTSIRGYVEGLQDGVVRDEVKFNRYLTVIRDKTDKLDELIEDLFRFSQLESGQLQMSLEEGGCSALLEAIVQPLEHEFADSRTTLAIVRPFPPGMLRADPVRLAQVFDNLVGNAVKYAGEDACVTIGATAAGNSLTVTVRDNGTEIAAEHLPHLFERFYRGDKSRSGEIRGSGLGLAICKHIIEAHGGRIGVRTEPGEGNVFFFSLPLL